MLGSGDTGIGNVSVSTDRSGSIYHFASASLRSLLSMIRLHPHLRVRQRALKSVESDHPEGYALAASSEELEEVSGA